jgi:hypothetical protein
MMIALKSVRTLLQGGIMTVRLIYKDTKDCACLKLIPNDQLCQQLLRKSSKAIILSLDIAFLQPLYPPKITH